MVKDIKEAVESKDKKEWANVMTKMYKIYVQKLDIHSSDRD